MTATASPLQSTLDTHFLTAVNNGLSSAQKTLPCKYFYDATGSQLFEQITTLQAYYVTRAELQLLRTHSADIATELKPFKRMIEPGSGAGIKVQILLNALDHLEQFIALEISAEILKTSTAALQERYKQLKVRGLVGDFTDPSTIQQLLSQTQLDHSSNIVFFPGSTIGNFEPEQAVTVLNNFKRLSGEDGAILVGVDLLKDESILKTAYDDPEGVTARFNKNILLRINRELGADFQLQHFSHEAYFNRQQQRIEMHLRSDQQQQVNIQGQQFNFAKGETIHTENSHKYSLESFARIAEQAGLKLVKSWHDADQYFAQILLRPA